jgi:pimeloyl-ACP methyl ester carboxylesterase
VVTLVLLPGLDGTGLLFAPFVEALGPKMETLVVTYPVDQALGYTELEGLVRAALPKTSSFVVLGESFSGPIAIRIAADPPAGMVGVILCVTFAKNPHASLTWMRPWLSRFPIKSLPAWAKAPFMWGEWSAARELTAVQNATAAVDEEVFRHRIAAVLSVDETNALRRVRMRMLVLRASEDRVVPRAASEHVLRILPSAQLAEVAGPHLLLLTRPEQCAAAAIRFLMAI